MKIYFATDVHGSEICWKRFLAASKFYDADTLLKKEEGWSCLTSA
jgi:Icc-related predicted phosphoesterase